MKPIFIWMSPTVAADVVRLARREHVPANVTAGRLVVRGFREIRELSEPRVRLLMFPFWPTRDMEYVAALMSEDDFDEIDHTGGRLGPLAIYGWVALRVAMLGVRSAGRALRSEYHRRGMILETESPTPKEANT